MTKTKISLGVIAVTVLTVATLFLLPLPQKITVRTERATRGSLMDTLLLEGVMGYGEERPFVSLQNGIIRRVYVHKGDKVKKGQLLFLMDMEAEEAAMAMVTAEINRLDGMEDALGGLLASRRMELKAQQETLKASIGAKQIRAEKDGVMSLVCCREGDMITQGTVLGSMHGEEAGISAYITMELAARLDAGTPAFVLDENGKRLGVARLEHVKAPKQEESTGVIVHQLWFSTEAKCVPGKRLTLEVIRSLWEDEVLVPLEAVSKKNEVWLVEEGKASPVKVSLERQSEGYVAVPAQLEGKPVILRPDESKLTPGGAVEVEMP
mgnify:CR=1 FL=1